MKLLTLLLFSTTLLASPMSSMKKNKDGSITAFFKDSGSDKISAKIPDLARLGKYQEIDLAGGIALGTQNALTAEITVEKSGTYLVNISATFSNNLNGASQGLAVRDLTAQIYLNNQPLPYRSLSQIINVGNGADFTSTNVSGKVALVSGDKIQVWASSSTANCCTIVEGSFWINPILQ